MPTFGTDADGFSITFDEPSRLLRVRAYGFWSPEVAATFAASVIEACRPPRRPKELVVDAADLKPQREEGQAALRSVFAALPGLGIGRASVLTGNALTKLQLLRLANAAPTRAMIEFTTNAGVSQ
jgi:hypothetical protein